jgi:flagellar hook assembly protein FlgD
VKEFLIISPSPGHTLSVTWDGTDDSGKPVGSGIYFYKLKAGDFQKVKKMILIK